MSCATILISNNIFADLLCYQRPLYIGEVCIYNKLDKPLNIQLNDTKSNGEQKWGVGSCAEYFTQRLDKADIYTAQIPSHGLLNCQYDIPNELSNVFASIIVTQNTSSQDSNLVYNQVLNVNLGEVYKFSIYGGDWNPQNNIKDGDKIIQSHAVVKPMTLNY